jgi:hypothetical protein
MQIVKEWERDGVSYRFVYNKKNTSYKSDYEVQLKKNKNWCSFVDRESLNLIGEWLKNEQMQTK